MRLSVPFLAFAAMLAVPVSVPAQTPPPPAAADSTVMLRPGDVLRVKVWREPDLSGEFMVDENGYVTLPLLGRKPLADRPLAQVRDELLRGYESELRNPAIEITPLRRVNVLGDVQRPGLYPVDPTVSLAGAVAMAGGATPLGDLRKIRVVRNGQSLNSEISSGRTLQDIDVRSGDQIFVGRRSWFDRNSTFLVSSLLSVTGIVIALLK